MTRTFLSWDGPLLPAAARLLVDHYAGGSPDPGGAPVEARMDGAVVVLPGARAGRRLRELLLEHAEARGLRLIPPRTVTVGTLPEVLLEPAGPVAPPALRRLAWAESLRTQPRPRIQELFSRIPDATSSAVAWRGLARELGQLSQTVAAGGLRFADVAARCRAEGMGREARRWDVLAQVQQEYERILSLGGTDTDEPGLLDPDLARLDAVARRDVASRCDLWLVGVAELPPIVRDLLRTLDPAPRIVVHAPKARAGAFDELGCVIPEEWAGATLPIPDEWISVVDRPSDQAEAVARELAALEGRHAADEILIGVPAPDVIPYVTERLERAGVPVRDGAGTPVSSSGPWRLLAAIADVLAPPPRDRTYESVAALVRHPDLHVDDATLAALDTWYTRHLPARLAGTPPRDEAVAALLQRLETVLLADLAGTRPLRAWPAPILALLDRVHAESDPASGTPPGRNVARALNEIRQSVEPFVRLPETLDPECTAADALRIFLDESAGTRIPGRADEAAVELLGWLELHLDDAPVTIVTGVNDGTLPEAVRGDAFLPDALRTVLGLEDNAQRHARDLYRLTAIVHSREVVRLVAGRRTAQGDPLRPSRLLFAADHATITRRVRRFYDPEFVEQDSGTSQPKASAGPDLEPVRPAAVSGFRLPPEDAIVLDPFPERIQVTAFRSLIADPYAWALERTRNLRPVDDTALEMDGGAFGSVVHEILERFGRNEVERHARGEVEVDETRIRRSLTGVMKHVLEKQFPLHPRISVRFQIAQLEARLRAFARWHANWLRQGWRVRAVEAATPEAGIPFEFGEGRSIGLSARIDRVDHNVDTGEWCVFDYKTSDEGKEPDETHRIGRTGAKEWVDLQLPLYRWLVRHSLEGLDPIADGEEVQVGYIVLPRDPDRTREVTADWSPSDFESALARARSVLAAVADGPVRFQPGRFPAFMPAELGALLGRGIMGGGTDEPVEAVDE